MVPVGRPAVSFACGIEFLANLPVCLWGVDAGSLGSFQARVGGELGLACQ